MKFIAAILFLAALAFAGADSTAVQPEPTNVAPVEQVSVTEFREELAVRDSVMQVRDSLCAVEKDSLRKSIVVEEAKCANWEQSYQTMKQNNEVCAQALSVSIGVSEKNKERADDERKKAMTMTSSSFLGGLAIGLLVMWLIMKN